MKNKSKNSNKTHRKQSRRSQAVSSYDTGLRRETVFRMPSGHFTIFPDRYFCSVRTTVDTIVSIGSASTIARQFQVYKINGIASSAGPAGVGPSINGAAFDANYPSGLYQLLGSTSNTGGNGIYQRYRVHSANIEVTWVPATNAASASNICPSQVCIFPTSDVYAAFSSMSVSQVTEQPLARHRYYPATSTAEPRKLRHSVGVLQILGDRFASTIEDPALSGTSAADPTTLTYFVVMLSNWFPNANAYLAEGVISVTITHNVELFQRNLQASVGPS